MIKKLSGILLILLASAIGGRMLLAERSPAVTPAAGRGPEVATDQPNYLPGTTAGIIGSYFIPNEMVTLQVLHADGTPSIGANHQPWSVQANSQGDFLAEWQVCQGDCLGLELQLTAVGQQSGLVATTLFGDDRQSITALNTGVDEWTAQLQGWFNLALQWGGTIQASNSKYTENNTIPLRFTSSQSPGTRHTVLLRYDFSNGGTARFFDSLGSFNASVTNADVLAGISNAGSPTYWPIPADASLPAGAQATGSLTTYNIGALSFGSYTFANGVKVLPVTFTVAAGSGSKNIVMAYGAHLASAAVWGMNNGSSQYPAASTKAYASSDDDGDSDYDINLQVSVSPGTVVSSADLAISKFAAPQPVFSGSNLTYTLIVANNGPEAASSVVVTDNLPPATALLSSSASQGTSSGTNPLTFNLGTLNVNATATITIVAKVLLATDGTLTNTASVSSATLDPNSANNAASVVSTVIDRTPPVITCPANLITNASPGQCSAVVGFVATAKDDEGTVGLSYNPPPGSTFPVGTNLVVCTATDPDGNKASCSFNVIVLDTEPPVVNVPANIAVNNDPGQCSAIVTFAANPTDNCGVLSTVYKIGAAPITSPYPFPVGQTTVTVTVTDIHNNTASGSFTVTVTDSQPPKVNVPANIAVNNDPGQCSASVTFAANPTDNCGVLSTVYKIGATPITSPYLFPVGQTTVNVTVTDIHNNTASGSFTVTVTDSEAPVVNPPANIAVSNDPGLCSASVAFAASPKDNCGVASTVYTIGASPITSPYPFPVGQTTVNVTVTDIHNNSALGSFTVTVTDSEAPVVNPPANIAVNNDLGLCSASVAFAANPTDNCGVLNTVYQIGATPITSPYPFPVGQTMVNVTVTDIHHNSAAGSFTVTVRDNQPPTITAPPDLPNVPTDPGQCATAKANVALGTPITGDNCGVASVVNNAPDPFPKGTTTVTWTVTDTSGNTATATQNVTVLDEEPPQIVCLANIITQADPGRCDAAVVFTEPPAVDNCDGVVPVVCNPPPGSVFPIGTNLVLCTATDAAGNTTNCVFLVVVQNPPNQSWPQALTLNLADNLGVQQASAQQCLTALDQSRWFKFKVQAGSRVIVTLTDLPVNYDLVLFDDIGAAYAQLTSQSDLEQLTAEFASEAFSPSAFSPSAFSPSAFSPSAFSPSAFSPSAFSPSAFSPSAFSPSAFSPSAFSPDAFSPSAFSPSAFSPSAFSPSAFSPSAFSPSAFSPSAFSAAQIQSVIAVSAFDGTASEGIVVDTWDNSGEFYVRVRGRNGVFSTGNAFQLNVYLLTGGCGSVSPIALDSSGNPLPASTTAAPAGNYKTLILTDLNRWLGSDSATKAAVSSQLNALAARPEVAGSVVDVGADPTVAFFNTQADANYDCPFAKNLVAGAIQGIVNRSRVGNVLQYVVLIGDDSVIPFFRYPDEALLGPEQDYVPPVKDLSASQASLRLNYVLGQDAYGAQCNFSHKTTSLPLPDLAVGRLVQSAAQVMGMLSAYLSTSGGVVPTPATALVTGYDFLADDAEAVQNEFTAGLGAPVDSLISPNTLAPSLCWTADNLRQSLFSQRHDLIFLAGHFSASDTLAADYATHFLASELAASSIDFKNTIMFSAGCHSGYNIVAGDSIPFVTLEPDWAQACAQQQATLVAGTGYQYGDTDFIEYSERLYLDFAKQLRTGSGPVAVGVALLNAKHDYLAATPEMRGIHAKTYLEAALFGLPMLSVNMPGTRLPASVSTPVISTLTPYAADPGATLGLSYADLAVTETLTPTAVVLNNTEAGTLTTATYLAGGDGLVNNPGEPILPLAVRNVAVSGTVMRGVGFRGGTYTDLPGQVPLTGAATTEIRGVHATFLSEVFYPMQPWSVNYFGSLCGGSDNSTRLMAIPGQFESDSPTASTGTIRSFSEMDFRLFYSGNITTYTDGQGNTSTPGLSGPPSVSAVQGVTSAAGDTVALSVRVVGNPAAGMQEVWVTYTAVSGPWNGIWQSIELAQNSTDSTLWQATLTLNGTASHDVRYMVQAVNGVGLVALDTKLGAYHVPDEFDSATTAQLTPTAVNFLTAASSGAFATEAAFSAQLTAAGGLPLSGQRMVFNLGDQQIWATTDPNGVANASLPLRITPGSYSVTATFAGAAGLAPSFATNSFSITRQTTALSITPSLVYVRSNVDTAITATLTDGAGNSMVERTVIFVVTGPNGAYAIPRITDDSGSTGLGAVPLPDGAYSVTAYFNGTIPLPGNQSVTVDDTRYSPTTTSGLINVTLVLDDTPPQINCSTNIVQSTDPGRCDAVVNYLTTATDDNPGVTLVCTPPSGSVFAKGTNLVSCVATDSAGNTSTCAFTVAVVDTEPPKVTCPNSIVTTSLPNLCSAPVSFSVAATDNCGSVTVVATPPSGASFPVGTNVVSVVATDPAGNSTTCFFTVAVLDTQPPQISCPQNILVNTDPGLCTAAVKFTLTATDNCSVASLVSTPPSGSVFPKGTTTVNCVATDSSGNTASCSFTVTVVDAQKPVLQTPANLVVGNDPGKASALVTFTVTATDNCQGVGVVCNPPSGSAFPLGTNLVTCTATDSAGNQATSTFTVTVKDVEPPVIKSLTASPNILSPPNERFVPVTLTVVATDNSGGPVTSKIVSVSSSEIDMDWEFGTSDWIITGPLTLKLEAEANKHGPGRTYTITVQCTDPSGNSATASTGVFVPAPK